MNDIAVNFFRFSKSNLKVYINISQYRSFLCEFIIYFAIAERLLMGLGVPSFSIYIIDVINFLLFLNLLIDRRKANFSIYILIYAIFIVIGVISAIPNYRVWGGAPFSTIIEVRNIIRFPIFFISCALYLKDNHIEHIFKVLTCIFYINFFLILYQYITYHPAGVWTRGDFLNGLFWTSVGGNTFVNALNIIIVGYWWCKWSLKKCSIWKFIIPFALSLAIAALIELKAFFVEIVILYLWYQFIHRKSGEEFIKSLMITVFMIVFAMFMLQIMFREYPWFRETMTLSGIINLVTDSSGYTGNNDLNRLNAVSIISKTIFNKDFGNILIGIGLGNGSTYSILGNYTTFFRLYSNLNYSWFSYSYTFVQCGIIGLTLYFFSFFYLLKKKKNKSYKLLSQLMIIISIMLLFYNETLKTDAGYFIYFAIARGFICQGNNVSENYGNNQIKVGISHE